MKSQQIMKLARAAVWLLPFRRGIPSMRGNPEETMYQVLHQ